MKRILMLMAVSSVMAALMVAMAMPAFAYGFGGVSDTYDPGACAGGGGYGVGGGGGGYGCGIGETRFGYGGGGSF